ncbi:hypothetical protein OESDEN_16064 [Oesophagostomum dentatum]|uniref:Uncharacterized protein n=1 Tax=Oesophagostomum dentatum TaxID=61180 RepID=A0A0B1SM11_OESDE|nr:hypothetical protein OESDEN_16064 [Oesophagostomum dentatum]
MAFFSGCPPCGSKDPYFTHVESTKLISLYCRDREHFHGKFRTGGKSGPSDRQTLLQDWAKEILSLGFSTRSAEQVEEKLKMK